MTIVFVKELAIFSATFWLQYVQVRN